LARRTNYKQEKRAKELDKIKKKEAKKERKLQRETATADEPEYRQDPQEAADGPGEERDADN
jgi:hypothetical protein